MDIEDINYFLQLVSFIILLVATVTILGLIRFRIDIAASFILVLYLCVMVIRLVPNNFERSSPVLLVLWPLASNLIWAALYYFIF
jgi:hypothetical protein